MAFGLHVHAIVAHYLLNQGTEEQKRKLPAASWPAARWSAPIAMSEPGAGSDLKGIRTTAVRKPMAATASTARRPSSRTATWPT
jgi:acyl-CoA dehydrogenase